MTNTGFYANLTDEEKQELEDKISTLQEMIPLAQKAKTEELMESIVQVLAFVLSGAVFLTLIPGILGYIIWLSVYGLILYYTFEIRKSDTPKYKEVAGAVHYAVYVCVMIVENPGDWYGIPHVYIGTSRDENISLYNRFVQHFPDMESPVLLKMAKMKMKPPLDI